MTCRVGGNPFRVVLEALSILLDEKPHTESTEVTENPVPFSVASVTCV
jgi:hypothetical protein